ncbi:hypothetical protein ANAPH2_00246 [Anaplasma phagocytophilum]|nr:hypothetical protein ANAPH2_00246 [Anaplasma phagocytophilum]
MMLLLDRLITLPLLLPKPLVKTSSSLRMLLIFLTLISMRRFVGRSGVAVIAAQTMVRILMRLTCRARTMILLLCVGVKEELIVAEVVVPQRFSSSL